MMSKRKLTEAELQYILQDLRPIAGLDPTISSNIHHRIVSDLKESLEGIEIYPAKISDLKSKIQQHYDTSQIQPGVSVGIVTSQSIGERQTQLALNSFHSTGMTTLTVVTGVPRFNELVNATKNPKSILTQIYFKDKPSSIHDIRTYIPLVKQCTFKDVLDSYTLVTDGKKSRWYGVFKVVYPDAYKRLRGCDRTIQCRLNLARLFESRLDISEIVSKIQHTYDGIQCAWSPTELGQLDLWFNSRELTLPNEHTSVETASHLFADDVVLQQLNLLTIKGVEGITFVDVAMEDTDKEWRLDAMGTNLRKLFACPFIDETRTMSNHMWELYQVLGIEAVREFLVQEFVNVISVESHINLRHIQLLVDVMLFTGDISSISRYGVHKNQSGALTKCSFEESLDQILNAGIYGENEEINGVSGAIITGKLSTIGTGMCDLMYNV